ncbi:MAG: hypothetical protein QW273_01345 [Candidatus Pacearchaeota archaeon]
MQKSIYKKNTEIPKEGRIYQRNSGEYDFYTQLDKRGFEFYEVKSIISDLNNPNKKYVLFKPVQVISTNKKEEYILPLEEFLEEFQDENGKKIKRFELIL